MELKLTGVKDTDYEILSNLDDQSLGRTCSLNSYTKELCANDTFWMNRTIQKFSSALGDVEEMRANKKTMTWRNYYIYLVDIVEQITDKKTPNLKIAKRMEQVMKKNEALLKKSFYPFNFQKASELLENNLIKLDSYIFTRISDLTEEEQKKIIPLIVSHPRFRAKFGDPLFHGLSDDVVKIILDEPRQIKEKYQVLLHEILVENYTSQYVFEKIIPIIPSSLIKEGIFDNAVVFDTLNHKVLFYLLDDLLKRGMTREQIFNLKYIEKAGHHLDSFVAYDFWKNVRIIYNYLYPVKPENLDRDFYILEIKDKITEKIFLSSENYEKILKIIDTELKTLRI